MSVEGLNAVLRKEEVVNTRQAHDFAERPKTIDDIYRAHLSTYVPMHGGANRDQQSVEGFTKRFINHVTERRVPRGYITADFGYGKTSAGLFVWGQAANSGQLAVPPFQLSGLSDFLTATAGWAHYRLGQSKPSLQSRAEEIYREAIARSAEDVAARYQMSVEAAQRLIEDRPQVQELNTGDLVRFFRSMTDLSLEAGFNGLMVIADEVQQYLEPQIKAGKGDPIGPLFDLIAGLGGEPFPFGLLLIIPQKEIGVINDQRGDLIDRIRNYALDLKTVYDDGFPARLWQHLGTIFDFADDAQHIMCDETLLSLSQIAIRPDLANGPRTVINAFRRAIKRYLDSGMATNQPYTPIALIEDFVGGDIAFDGEKRIQAVVARALEHPLIKQRQEYIDAVKLAAAFPTYGATTAVQQAFGLRDAFLELRDQVYGQVVQHGGNPADPGITLIGLEQAQVEQNWLNAEILEFSRNYVETAANVKMRAMHGFTSLLRTIVFKSGWQARETFDSGMGYSAGINFEGAYASFKREFPERMVHAYIVFDDERSQPVTGDFDALVEFRLRRYLDLDEQSRQSKVTPASSEQTHNTAYLTLNLVRRVPEGMNRAVEPLLTKVIAPERLNPLFLLAMHGYFESRLELGRVDKAEQPFLTGNFMPALLDSAALMLLDRPVAGIFDAAGPKLIEMLVSNLLRERYGTDYRTLMSITTWRDSLRTYANILRRLESPMQMQGVIPVEGTRDQTMKLINLTATAFDTLAGNLPDLIEIVTDFKKSRSGAVRFTLHPLETSILEWLAASPNTVTSNEQRLHRITEGDIKTQAKRRGYKAVEVDQIITLMAERELIYHDKQGFVVERPSVNVTIEEVSAQIEMLISLVALVQQSFPEAIEIQSVAENAGTLSQTLRQLRSQRKQPDSKALALLDNTARNNLKRLDDTLRGRIEALKAQSERIVKRYKTLTAPSIDSLLPVDSAVDNELPYLVTLENVRQTLVERCSQATAAIQERQARVDEVVQSLIDGNYPQDTLPALVREIRAFEDGFDQLSADLTSLTTIVAAYSPWVRIVSVRRSVLGKIAELGRDGRDISSQVERLDTEIAAHLAQEWQVGLLQGDTYERRFKALNDAADEIEKQANRRFQRLQDTFIAQLRSANCPEDKLWSAIIFSQTESQRVHEQLYTYAWRATIATVDNTEGAIQRLCSELRQKLASPDRERIAEPVTLLLAQLTELAAKLPYPSANDPQTVRGHDGQPSETFYELIRLVKGTWEDIELYQKRIADLKKGSSEKMFTPIEDDIISHLGSESMTDLGLVWEQMGSSGADAIWTALRSLWENEAIQIGVGKRV